MGKAMFIWLPAIATTALVSFGVASGTLTDRSPAMAAVVISGFYWFFGPIMLLVSSENRNNEWGRDDDWRATKRHLLFFLTTQAFGVLVGVALATPA